MKSEAQSTNLEGKRPVASRMYFCHRYVCGHYFRTLSKNSNGHQNLNNRILPNQITKIKRNDFLKWINYRKQENNWVRNLKKQYLKLQLKSAQIRKDTGEERKARVSSSASAMDNQFEHFHYLGEFSGQTARVIAEKIRAFVFDVLHGSGAHTKSLIFLTSYKIPKRRSAPAICSRAEENNSACNSSSDEECFSVVTVDIGTYNGHQQSQFNEDRKEFDLDMKFNPVENESDNGDDQIQFNGDRKEIGLDIKYHPVKNESDIKNVQSQNGEDSEEDLDILIINAEEDDFLFPEE